MCSADGLRMSGFSAVPSLVPTVYFSQPARPKELDAIVAEQQIGKLSKQWSARHYGISDATLPRIRSAPKRRLCHEAERCVCRGNNKDLFFVASKLQNALLACKRAVGEKTWNLRMKNCDLVCCVSWQDSAGRGLWEQRWGG